MKYEIGQVNRLGNRSSNQDRSAAVVTEEGVLLVLGDGMGGQAFGEVAAEILVDEARKAYLAVSRPVRQPGAFLREVLVRSHQAITDFGVGHDPSAIPGTTAVLCLIQNGEACWAHVGDSRLYLYQGGLPLYRTTDHSYVEALYQRGKISRREQENHPQRNQVTECLGVRLESPRIAVSKPVTLKPGDIVMLCSDGLWNALDDTLMGSLILAEEELEQSLYRMAEEAERISYPRSDNISVLALRFEYSDVTQAPCAEEATQTPSGDSPDARLQAAIASIEHVLSKYEKEFQR